MLSYRHGYHAGNPADVVKHVVLVALIESLRRKEKPFYIQDSHAGKGIYALDSEEALLGREYADGIGRLWNSKNPPGLVQSYLDIVRQYNSQRELRNYPGSPSIIRAMLRPGDRCLLTEMHPSEHQQLVQLFQGDRQVQVHKQDAYQGLKAFLPPPERRGLVLIDPPYERKDEYMRVVAGLVTAYTKWSQGIYAIWYPLMSQELQKRFITSCRDTGIRKMLHITFMLEPTVRNTLRFTGSGLVVINPPWQLEQELGSVLDWLAAQLHVEAKTEYCMEWLNPE